MFRNKTFSNTPFILERRILEEIYPVKIFSPISSTDTLW